MARERWFYAQHHQRRGPVPLSQLVESVLAQVEPRSVLVWRKGLADWALAEDVPEVEQRLGAVPARPAPAPAAAPAPIPRAARGANALLLYGGLATGVAVTGLVAWLLWPRSAPPRPQVVPLGGTTADNAPAILIPAPAVDSGPSPAPVTSDQPLPATTAPSAPTPAPAGIGSQERDLPMSELRKLKQIAGWSGTRLELTLVNNTDWRITQLFVTVQRFVGNEIVDDDTPVLLLPPEVAMDDEVASLLSKVAPERRKPGVNPLDTGRFSGQVGPRPEGFRCEIVSARGYPPR